MPEFAARLPLEPSTPPPPREAWATQISPAKSEPAKRSNYRQPPALPSDDAANTKPPGWSPPASGRSPPVPLSPAAQAKARAMAIHGYTLDRGMVRVHRPAPTLAVQWSLALVGLACLASTSAASACPVGAGDDPTVNFGVVAFALDLAYTTSMLIALGRAAHYQQLACWARPWVESLSSLLLAFLGYSAAVGVSTLETSMHRLFPSDCTHAHANFRKLSAGCAFLWLLLIASFIPRLFLIRVHNVLSDLTKSGTFSEVSQDAAADDAEREQLGRTLEMSRQMPATLV